MKPETNLPARGAAAALLLLLFALACSPAATQPLAGTELGSRATFEGAANDPIWARWDEAAARAEALLRAEEPEGDAVEAAREEMEAQRAAAGAIAERASAELGRLTRELDALGPAPAPDATEPEDVSRLRGTIGDRVSVARVVQGRAERVAARADGLLPALASAAKRRLVAQLVTRRPSPVRPVNWARAAEGVEDAFGKLAREIERSLSDRTEQARLRRRGPAAAAALLLAFAIGFGLRSLALGFLRRAATRAAGKGRRILAGVAAAVARLLILSAAAIAFLAGIATLDLTGQVGAGLLDGFGDGLLAFVLAYALGAAFFSPRLPETRLARLDEREAWAGFTATVVLGGVYLVDLTLRGFGEAARAGPTAGAVETFAATLVGAAALWRLASLAPSSADAEHGGHLGDAARRAFRAVALLAPVLAALGYEFAARFLFFSFVETVALVAVGWLIYRVTEEAVDLYLAAGRGEAEGGQRLRLLPLLVGFLLICVGVPALALIWGATVADLDAAWRRVSGGLTIGDVTISPAAFFVFVLVFALGYAVTRAAQKGLRDAVLPKTGMSVGAAEALSAGIGYLGVAIAALIGISAAGIDLSSLALVVGALSVGIGLGLQGVVNNFVSGIILLIERPVKVGDWIDVGGVQGNVRKVNVRSTEIETFDRSTYILPNSSLISGPVTNYTHHDLVGRAIVPIGVAYGTDTRRVEAVLLEIARANPLVLSFPAPVAVFTRFGASSLDFELRVILRDVNAILMARSELNHAIAARFAAEGIEIPFPQTDLHVRSVPPAMLGEGRNGPAAPGPEEAKE